MDDEPTKGNLLAMLLDGMKLTENVWRGCIRGHAARGAGRSIAATPAAALEVCNQGKARGAKPVSRIRLAKKEMGSNRELVEWIGDAGETDLVFESEGIEIVIDPVSLQYLNGLTLDFIDGAFRLDRLDEQNTAT